MNNQDKVRKPNAWVQFLKEQVVKKNTKYGTELLDSDNKVLYAQQKQKQQKKSEPKKSEKKSENKKSNGLKKDKKDKL
jgi:hypothetical protein